MTVGLRKRSTSSTAKEKKKVEKKKVRRGTNRGKNIPFLKKLFYPAIILKI